MFFLSVLYRAANLNALGLFVSAFSAVMTPLFFLFSLYSVHFFFSLL